MKEIPLLARRLGDALYADLMARELRAIPREKIAASTVQAPSTQRTLDRDPALDEEWWNRPLPAEAIAASKRLQEAKTDEERAELVAARKLDPQQVQIIEAHRRHSKNTLGQSEAKGSSEKTLSMAIEAFVHSPPAKLTQKEREKLTELSGYTKPPPPPEEPPVVKVSFWRRFFFWRPKPLKTPESTIYGKWDGEKFVK